MKIRIAAKLYHTRSARRPRGLAPIALKQAQAYNDLDSDLRRLPGRHPVAAGAMSRFHTGTEGPDGNV